jgi:hypothetical protein
MQTSSSETLIGWKSGKTKPLMSLNGTEWKERGYDGLRPKRESKRLFEPTVVSGMNKHFI